MRHRLTLGLLAATGVVLAGCGASVPDGARDAAAFECPLGEEGCDVNEPVGDGGEFRIVSSSGGDEFSFAVDEDEGAVAVTGQIEVEFINEGAGVHNVEFIGASEGSDIVEATGGDSATGEVGLFPGEWTYFCNIGDHRQQGMEGVVQVFSTEEELDQALEDGIEIDDDEMPAA